MVYSISYWHWLNLGSLNVCVCVCVCMCVYVCLHVWMWVCMYVCKYTYICMYVWMYVCMHVCVCVCMYVCVFMSVCVCKDVCMYVCMSDVTRWHSEEQSSLATVLEPNLVFPLCLYHRIIGSLAEVRTQYYTMPRWRCKPHLSALVGLQKSNLDFWCTKALIVTYSYVKIAISEVYITKS